MRKGWLTIIALEVVLLVLVVSFPFLDMSMPWLVGITILLGLVIGALFLIISMKSNRKHFGPESPLWNFCLFLYLGLNILSSTLEDITRTHHSHAAMIWLSAEILFSAIILTAIIRYWFILTLRTPVFGVIPILVAILGLLTAAYPYVAFSLGLLAGIGCGIQLMRDSAKDSHPRDFLDKAVAGLFGVLFLFFALSSDFSLHHSALDSMKNSLYAMIGAMLLIQQWYLRKANVASHVDEPKNSTTVSEPGI